MPRNVDWDTIKKAVLARAANRGLSSEYVDRLNFEIKEIEKQGANAYWADRFNSSNKYETNKNGLVLPWLLGLTPVDPLTAKHNIVRSIDQPDIDIDCLPGARDKIKAYAAQKYGVEHVCSVGTWLTYKFKLALQDAARGLGAEVKEAMAVTKVLPDDVDELKDGGQAACSKCGVKHNKLTCPACGSQDADGITIGRALEENEPLRIYNDTHPEIVDAAVKLLGKIRAMGKHAGGIIITNKILLGNIPMSISKGSDGAAQWTSMWTEGRNTQLSKLGYVKWDLLGLKTLQYIFETCKLIEATRGHKFNPAPWMDNNPEENSVGWYLDPAGVKHNVPMDDKEVFKMLNDLKLETVFQFETDVQRGVLANGVRNYYDLQVFNAMGHPGPIAFIPEYVARRDDIQQTWRRKEHPDVADALAQTHGIICYQRGSRVSMADGTERVIECIGPGDLIHSLNYNTKRIEAKPVISCGPTITGSGLKITLCNGYGVVVTPNHKIMTNNSMIQARHLTNNDLVAAPIVLPTLPKGSPNPKYWDTTNWLATPTSVAYLFGQLVGDGRLTGTSTSICVGSEADADSITEWLHVNIPKLNTIKFFSTRSWYLSISCSDRIGRFSKFKKLTTEFGLRTSCHHKRIPTQILTADTSIKSAFIAGLIDSDGCLAVSNAGEQICYISSINPQLLEDIRRICSGLGIITKLYHNNHRIYIYDTYTLNKLCAQYLVTKKLSGHLTRGLDISYAPRQILNDLKKPGESVRKFCKRIKINRRNYNLKNKFIKYSTATRFADFGDVRYYKIKSIEQVDSQQFYNLTVEPYHNLVVNGIIASNCYQEDLQKLWQKFASFTAPEAEAARKAVAKKWVEKLKPVKEQWLRNAAKTLGPEWADKMWERMQTFGRYAFNKSHSTAYILIAYWCAWLKTHFAPEWWASVMSDCDSDRVPKYMNTARREGVKFGPIDANNLTIRFSVDGALKVTPGLTSIKGVGDKAAANLTGSVGATDIDSFIEKNGRNKRVMEPLIKLGAFERYHTNLKATWMWYQYKYCSGKDITELKKSVRKQMLAEWTDEKLQIERARQISEFKKLWPKRKTPAKLLNYQPKINDTREAVMALYPIDFTLKERLAFEKQYLGYFWHRPMDLYHSTPGRTIQAVKDSLGKRGKVEAVVDKLTISKTKAGKRMGRLKISDGISDCTVVLWAAQLNALEKYLEENVGLRFDIEYDKERDSFTLSRNSNGETVIPLPLTKINEEPD